MQHPPFPQLSWSGHHPQNEMCSGPALFVLLCLKAAELPFEKTRLGLNLSSASSLRWDPGLRKPRDSNEDNTVTNFMTLLRGVNETAQKCPPYYSRKDSSLLAPLPSHPVRRCPKPPLSRPPPRPEQPPPLDLQLSAPVAVTWSLTSTLRNSLSFRVCGSQIPNTAPQVGSHVLCCSNQETLVNEKGCN